MLVRSTEESTVLVAAEAVSGVKFSINDWEPRSLQAWETATTLTQEALGGVIFARGGGIGLIETIALMAEVTIGEIRDGESIGEESSVFRVGSGASIALARSDVGVRT
jgi:hypothetical protein